MPALRPDALRGRAIVAPLDLAGVLGEAGASLVTEPADGADLIIGDLRSAIADAQDWVDAVARATGEAFAVARAAYDAAGAAGLGLVFLLRAVCAAVEAEATLVTAIASLARSVAVEWAPARIRVNCVIDRGAPAEAIGDVLGYLASPAAFMMTGQVIEVGDG